MLVSRVVSIHEQVGGWNFLTFNLQMFDPMFQSQCLIEFLACGKRHQMLVSRVGSTDEQVGGWKCFMLNV